jgi:transposase
LYDPLALLGVGVSQAEFDGGSVSWIRPRGRRAFCHARPRKYPQELIERGVRLALESERPIAHVADDLGIHRETLRKRVRQAEADSGKRADLLSTQEREEVGTLRREVKELRRANEILKAASVFFAKELDPDRTK